MKRFVSLALVVAIVAVAFVSCGLVYPNAGTYTDEYKTTVIEIGAYDEETESGTMSVVNSLNDDINYTGTYTLEENDPDVSSILVFTTSDGQVIEYLYDVTMDVLQDLESQIIYYGPNAVVVDPEDVQAVFDALLGNNDDEDAETTEAADAETTEAADGEDAAE